jgi:hypothetical protein
MNNTHIAGREWSGIFTGRLEIRPSLTADDVTIQDEFGMKFYTGSQIIDVCGDERLLHVVASFPAVFPTLPVANPNIICPKCWTRAAKGLGEMVCGFCGESGCESCITDDGEMVCNHCRERA